MKRGRERGEEEEGICCIQLNLQFFLLHNLWIDRLIDRYIDT